MNLLSKIALLPGIAAFVLVLFSFFLPWYHVSTDTYTLNGETLLGGAESEFYTDEWIQIVTLGNSETSTDNLYGDSNSWTAVGDFMDTFSLLLIVGMVVLIVSATSVLLGNKKVALLLGIVALVMVLVCILIFYASIDNAVNESSAQSSNPIDGFMGSDSTSAVLVLFKMEWGPMIGWWILFVALLAQIGELVIVARS